MTDLQAAVGDSVEFQAATVRRSTKEELCVPPRGTCPPVARLRLSPKRHRSRDPSWFGLLLTVPRGRSVLAIRRCPIPRERANSNRVLFAGNLLRHPCFDEITRDGRRVSGHRRTDGDRSPHGTAPFWIGVYPGMAVTHLDYMIDRIRRVLSSKLGLCRFRVDSPPEGAGRLLQGALRRNENEMWPVDHRLSRFRPRVSTRQQVRTSEHSAKAHQTQHQICHVRRQLH